jgi:hypothetical protein
MAFVRAKRVKGRDYYQLVASHRVGGKPRQKVVLYLGKHPTVNDALAEWPKEIKKLRDLARKERKKLQRSAEDPTVGRAHRTALRRASSAEQRANIMQVKLKRLRELRKQGAV